MQHQPDENLVQSAAKLSELIVQALLKTEDALHDSSESSSDSAPPSPGLREQSLSTYLSQDSIRKSSETKATAESSPDTSEASIGVHSPISFLLDELRKKNPPRGSPRTYPALDLEGVFHKHTSAELNAYDRDVITAVNREDLEQLRQLHSAGHLMEASNQFGETLVHGACRRGSLDVTRFLVEQGGATVMCCDQQGMTPLHLACRTPKPNYKLVKFILDQKGARDLIFVADKRGYTPLDCTPAQTWSGWIDFLRDTMRRPDGPGLMPSHAMFYTPVNPTSRREPTRHESTLPDNKVQEETVSNPLLGDIDSLLKSYDAQHKQRRSLKKSKRRKSSRKHDTDSVDQDSNSSLGSDQETVCTSNASDSTESERSPRAERTNQLKSDLSHLLLDKLNKSIGSGLGANAEAMKLLEGLNTLDPTTLLETIRLKRAMDFEINHMERVETRYEEKKAQFLDIERNYFYHKQQLAQAEATVKQAMAIEIAARKALEHAVEQVGVAKQSYIEINNAYRSLDKQHRSVQAELEVLGRTVAAQQSRIRAQLNPEHRRLEPPREEEDESDSGASESEHSQETIRTKNIASAQREI